MPEYQIIANLPFPLRVNPPPCSVSRGDITWSLLVERVQRATPDERVATGASNVDLLVDRVGQLAYSHVTATASGEQGYRDAVTSFLRALNRLILHVRDTENEYWIHTLDVADLYGVSVTLDGVRDQVFTAGRGQGLMNAVIGISDRADAALRSTLSTDADPPVWRQIQLDARDA